MHFVTGTMRKYKRLDDAPVVVQKQIHRQGIAVKSETVAYAARMTTRLTLE